MKGLSTDGKDNGGGHGESPAWISESGGGGGKKKYEEIGGDIGSGRPIPTLSF
jgi:hypothetical protein